MSRQKRTAPRQHSEPQVEHGQEATRGPDQAEELQLGNQAHQDRLVAGEASMDVVRDSASPFVERAILALQIEARPSSEVGRFTEILDGSRLPEERRAILVDRLRTDQAAARGIGEAVRRWFQEDGRAVRDQLTDTLDRVLDGLQEGAAAGGQWTLPDGGQIQLSSEALEGPVSARVEALVRDLAQEVSPAGVQGAAVQGFCRDVQLALLWDEEEEEVDFGGDYAAEESGV